MKDSIRYFITLVFTCLILYHQSFGQKIIKENIKLNGEFSPYLVIEPTDRINGIILLLGGRGERTKDVLKNSNLPVLFASKGYLTIIPEVKNSFYANDQVIEQITKILQIQKAKHPQAKTDLIIGGFSIGGTIGISYAEYILAANTTNLKGIFAIDAPLDFERLYASAERKINYHCGGLIQKEGFLFKENLNQKIGNSHNNPTNKYVELSPFSSNINDEGNAKWLKKMPIRLYIEPDLDFVQKKYCQELQYDDINAIDSEKLYQNLYKMGNDKVELIKTKGRGFHSWKIVDPVELMYWIEKLPE